MQIRRLLLLSVGTVVWTLLTAAACPSLADELRLGVFNVDATPPIGSPVAYAPARKILDPLSARGVVLLGAERPVVLCAVDWIGIANGGHDAWRRALAEAANTTPERVTVHALHQHDGARCDFTAQEILAERNAADAHFDDAFLRATLARAAEAVRRAVAESRPVTHVGTGQACVEKVASNRRLLGDDGKVKLMRWSKSTIPAAIAAPEGVIDPLLRLVCFYDGDAPLAALTYYATHPQSYYGQGDVTAEFIGLARAAREKALPTVTHIHFNGAGGNVAAGKYNDGSAQRRPVLASRMQAGMRAAWQAQTRRPLAAGEVQWRVHPVALPPAAHLDEQQLLAILDEPGSDARSRINAASHLAWLRRCRAGHQIELSCLKLGDVYLVHMPGELFVEFQLAAQQMRPDDTVCMAAYGDYGPGYIGTEIAYSQGGYETSPRASRVAPHTEGLLLQALRELLR